ncbi:hypothetical protein O3P69_016095 [Scylla paramamosain]|uniref:Ribonucleotide reductase large subunit C-terminal domain-containing protein n=1 Tax=Scylla paramamosain TaxID=85552 RepID=A0AAW0T9V0_SCYPA
MRNLNKIIDMNYYTVQEARRSNMRQRPSSIRVLGLANAFILMRYPFDSPKAQLLNKHIFETIYCRAMEASYLHNWGILKKVAKNSVHNSLLLVLMPTASTTHILGNNKSIETYTSTSTAGVSSLGRS